MTPATGFLSQRQMKTPIESRRMREKMTRGMGHAEACGCDRAGLAILQRLLDGASPDLLVRGDDAHSEVGEQACGLHGDEEAVADTHLLVQLGAHREICPQHQPGGGGLQLVDRLAPSLVGEWRDARHAVQHEVSWLPRSSSLPKSVKVAK